MTEPAETARTEPRVTPQAAGEHDESQTLFAQLQAQAHVLLRHKVLILVVTALGATAGFFGA